MTRYTKLQRKTHEKSTGFDVTPLLPTKKASTEENKAKNENGKKRKRNTNPEKAAKEADKRKIRRQLQKFKNTICFGCRKKGHAVGDCPEAKQKIQGICYNCGTTEHTLKECKKPRKGNELPYAKCFVCKEVGHLSSQCPKNDHGLYPNGGGCRFCGQVDHLAKDCKMTKEQAGTTVVGKIDLDQGADDDDYHIFVNEKQKLVDETKKEKKIEAAAPVLNKKKKLVKFM
ncbi:Zinc finger CCHC domain-containing protein 9 [Apophysomyces ossiformis]|uniref:Zinc finger CCHC domain-containing protein 9 n=1 Tax=Apophysomyces ossiformis TaxID=679940 RepID=A0A8H7BJR6_9FUNG|nr:Zinc finger CCHC domain-containing protein 9 [Apophysomyces ossiformis]